MRSSRALRTLCGRLGRSCDHLQPCFAGLSVIATPPGGRDLEHGSAMPCDPARRPRGARTTHGGERDLRIKPQDVTLTAYVARDGEGAGDDPGDGAIRARDRSRRRRRVRRRGRPRRVPPRRRGPRASRDAPAAGARRRASARAPADGGRRRLRRRGGDRPRHRRADRAARRGRARSPRHAALPRASTCARRPSACAMWPPSARSGSTTHGPCGRRSTRWPPASIPSRRTPMPASDRARTAYRNQKTRHAIR